MIFLYRFEVLKLDGVMSSLTPPTSYTTLNLPDRQLYLLTNYERPIRFGSKEPFASAFLPKMGNVGIDTNTGWAFQPEGIDHEGLRLDDEKESGQLTVTLPIEHPIAQLFVLEAPGVQVWLTLAQVNTTSQSAEPEVIWTGQVVKPAYDESRAKLTLDSIVAVISRAGLTAKHPRTCGHILFDQATCGVKASTFDYSTTYFKYREDGELLSISEDGMTVTILAAANRPAGYFSEGFLVIGGEYSRDTGNTLLYYPRGGTTVPTPQGVLIAQVNAGYRRAIIGHDGATLTLATPLPPLDLSQPDLRRVTMFAGCDSLQPTCKSKFNNGARYGGYPYIPLKNLFESGVKTATNN